MTEYVYEDVLIEVLGPDGEPTLTATHKPNRNCRIRHFPNTKAGDICHITVSEPIEGLKQVGGD